MRKKRQKKIVDRNALQNLMVCLTTTRNNYFVNLLDFSGTCFFRTSGGTACTVKGYSRSKKKSREVIAVLSLYTRIFIKRRKIYKLAFIYRGGYGTFKYFLRRILQKRKGTIPFVYIGRNVTLPHGGCRAGRRRNMRSGLKLKLRRKKNNNYEAFN